jgi:hypothetical protein
VNFQYITATISIKTPGRNMAKRQPRDFSTPRLKIAMSTHGMIDWVTPPPALPQPALVAFADPTTLGANMTEVWYCVMTKLAPIAPISRRKKRNDP